MGNSSKPEIIAERIKIKSFVAENYNQMTMSQMAKELDVSYKKVIYAAESLGVKHLIKQISKAAVNPSSSSGKIKKLTRKEKLGFFDVDAETNWLVNT